MAKSRLLQNLSAMRGKRLALVAAPFGTGKTTLLTESFRQLSKEGFFCAWLNLDNSESCPCRFARHLTLAVQTALPQTGSESLKQLDSSPESALSCLINDLAASPGRVAIFIDNFHEADSAEVASLLSYFLRYLPAGVLVVLASLRSFPQPLSWARARDWTIELSWKDLCLDQAEIRAYLFEQQALRLCESEFASLAELTEGWFGALQLATRNLRQTLDRTAEQRLLTLSNGDFAAPLMEELVASLPHDLQDFLLKSSILEKLSPSLCDAIQQKSGSHSQIKELERTFGLLFPCQGEWFRYPRLLARFLGLRLQSESPELFALLHRRAGDWFLTNHQPCQALQHWLKAGALEAVAQLLGSQGKSLLLNARRMELAEWLACLPGHLIDTSPELCTLRAWSALITAQPLVVDHSLNKARIARQTQTSPAPASEHLEWFMLRALSGICRHDWPEADVSDSILLQHNNHASPLLQTCTQLTQAHLHRYRNGELSHAQTGYRNAAELAESHGLQTLTCLAQQGQAMIDLLLARPDRALGRIERWLAATPSDRNEPQHGTGLLLTLQAQALMDKNQYQEAATQLNEAISLLDKGSTSGHLGLAYVLRAGLLAENGNSDAAHGDLARARTLAMPQGIARVLFRADLREASLCLAEESMDEAGSLLDRALHLLEDSGQYSGENFEAWQIMRCTWLLAMHHATEARDLALEGENKARNAGRLRHCIDFLLLRAAALANLPGHQATSRECIEQARQLAKAGGVCRPFRCLTPALELLQPHPDNDRQTSEAPLRMPDHLHQREEQILRLLEQGLRNREIAARLFLSDETVKWYLKRLYGNFAVENRVQLLATVRKLGLLGDGLH